MKLIKESTLKELFGIGKIDYWKHGRDLIKLNYESPEDARQRLYKAKELLEWAEKQDDWMSLKDYKILEELCEGKNNG